MKQKINNYIEQLENDIEFYENRRTHSAIERIVRDNDIEMLEQIKEDLEELLEGEC